jgi:hypothetical protein
MTGHHTTLDLDTGTLTIDETLISVGGRAEESDGKTAAGVRTVSPDDFTIAALHNGGQSRRYRSRLIDTRAASPASACISS